MHLQQRSVNVSRSDLLLALRRNLDIHKAEYAEALADFKLRLISDLEIALKAAKTLDVNELEDFKFNFEYPQSHADQISDVIEMLEFSTDETINLDSTSFKAYFKNEWPWKKSFDQLAMSYKAVGSFLK